MKMRRFIALIGLISIALLASLMPGAVPPSAAQSLPPANTPPAIPADPSPLNGVPNQSSNVDLAWADVDSDSGDSVVYGNGHGAITPGLARNFAISPTLLFFDDFSNSSSGWITVGDSSCSGNYEAGGYYRVTVGEGNRSCVVIPLSAPPVVNGTFSTSVRRISDPSRSVLYGFFFGAGTDINLDCWELEVSPDSVSDCEGSTRPFFWLSYLQGGSGELVNEGNTCTNAINTGNEWNELKVIRNGANVKVYLNGQRSADYDRSVLLDKGHFLLEVTSGANPVTVDFDYFMVTDSTPEPSPVLELSPLTKSDCYAVTNQGASMGEYAHAFYDQFNRVVYEFADTIPALGTRVYEVSKIAEVPRGFAGRLEIASSEPSSASLVSCPGGTPKLSSSPGSVPADDTSTSTVTLSGAPAGHQVRLISNRSSIDTFASAIGQVSADGLFVTTVRSATAGTAIVTAEDSATGKPFAASTRIEFTAIAGEPPPPANEGPITLAGINSQVPLDNRFLEGISLSNRISVSVDWHGTEPGKIDFTLNGVTHSIPASTEGASYNLDMGTDLKPGFNNLSIIAYNESGQASQSLNYRPYLLEKPVWVAALQTAGALAEFVLDGPVSFAREYKSTFKFPKDPISLGAPGFGPPGSTSELSFFVGGSARLSLQCDKPLILTGEGGLKPKLDLMGLEFGGELKGSGTIVAGAVECRIPTAEGNLRLDITVYGQKNWPVLTFVIDFIGPGAGTSLEQTLRAAGLYKLATLLGEVYLQGRLSGFIESGVRLQTIDPYLAWEGVRFGGGPGIEVGYRFDQLGTRFRVFLGVDGKVAFENPNPLADLSDIHFNEAIVTGQGGWKLKPPLLPCEFGKTYQVEWTYPPAHYEATLISETGCELNIFSLSRPVAVFQGAPNTLQAFAPIGARLATMGLSAQSTVTNVLVSNVYTYPEPSLALNPTTGNGLLLWVHDDLAKPVGQSQEIRFTRWSGSTWSTPANVTNDNQLDGAPDVAWSGNGDAVAVWQRLNDTLPITATWDVTTAKKIEIATSVYSPTTDLWTPVTLLTANTALDMEPRLARNKNGQLLATWRQNEAGLLGGDTTDPDNIMVAFYNTDWEAPAVAVGNIPGLIDLAPGYGAGTAALAFTRYLTPTGYPTPTLQLFTSIWNGVTWSSPVQQTDDALGHRTPRVIYNAANQPLVVWLAGDELRLRNLATSATTSLLLPPEVGDVDEFRVVQDATNIAVVFTAQGQQRDLYTAFYDQTHDLWGNPTRLTNDRASEAYPAPALDSTGRLLMGYATTAITSITQTTTISGTGEVVTYTLPIEGQTDLVTLSHEFTRNLTLTDADLVLSDNHPLPGGTVVVSATVHNSGDLALDGVAVGFYDGDPAAGGSLIGTVTLATPLAGGFTATLTTNYSVPSNGGAHRLYAVADPANIIIEADETDNKASMAAFGPDLEIVASAVDYWGGTEVGLQTLIRNIGTSPAPTATLIYYHEALSGTLIVTDTVPTLAASEAITLTTPWNFGGLAAGSYSLVSIVNQIDFTETFTSNNISTLTLDVRPDLMVSPYYVWTTALTETAVSITATVYNVGAVPAQDVLVGFYQSESLDTGALLFTRTIPTLTPGSSVQLSGETSGPLNAGVYVMVDPNWVLTETTRVNNLAAVSAQGENSKVYLPVIMKK